MYVSDVPPAMFFLGGVLHTKNVVKLSEIWTLAGVDELLSHIRCFISVCICLYLTKDIT